MPTHRQAYQDKAALLAELESWVRETLEADRKRAHGCLHTDRVRVAIRVLAQAEGVDLFLAEAAALLHDVGRTQAGPEAEHGARSASIARPLLEEMALDPEDIREILHAIRWHNSLRADSALLRILRDADMLDGLGAMGIMRAFMSKSHLLAYDADFPFQDRGNRWPPDYASDQLIGQMAWYDGLNTGTARQMATKRIAFMRAFVTQARDEIQASAESQQPNAYWEE